eukprot:Cvel_28633.t1-p1 / transcript=Cvel_28633.t1 / gene=Cvel_28633 / organism=Chromera_velia_CCMP2878 / gene_product=hypothetical protein / transcript_product=hypothetical protein / location=Cvel_scaffold3784:1-3802(-) / protein_length=1061 / sequence_SO=supercontig / SO=protein_coding / is_pseudo=false
MPDHVDSVFSLVRQLGEEVKHLERLSAEQKLELCLPLKPGSPLTRLNRRLRECLLYGFRRRVDPGDDQILLRIAHECTADFETDLEFLTFLCGSKQICSCFERIRSDTDRLTYFYRTDSVLRNDDLYRAFSSRLMLIPNIPFKMSAKLSRDFFCLSLKYLQITGGAPGEGVGALSSEEEGVDGPVFNAQNPDLQIPEAPCPPPCVEGGREKEEEEKCSEEEEGAGAADRSPSRLFEFWGDVLQESGPGGGALREFVDANLASSSSSPKSSGAYGGDESEEMKEEEQVEGSQMLLSLMTKQQNKADDDGDGSIDDSSYIQREPRTDLLGTAQSRETEGVAALPFLPPSIPSISLRDSFIESGGEGEGKEENDNESLSPKTEFAVEIQITEPEDPPDTAERPDGSFNGLLQGEQQNSHPDGSSAPPCPPPEPFSQSALQSPDLASSSTPQAPLPDLPGSSADAGALLDLLSGDFSFPLPDLSPASSAHEKSEQTPSGTAVVERENRQATLPRTSPAESSPPPAESPASSTPAHSYPLPAHLLSRPSSVRLSMPPSIVNRESSSRSHQPPSSSPQRTVSTSSSSLIPTKDHQVSSSGHCDLWPSEREEKKGSCLPLHEKESTAVVDSSAKARFMRLTGGGSTARTVSASDTPNTACSSSPSTGRTRGIFPPPPSPPSNPNAFSKSPSPSPTSGKDEKKGQSTRSARLGVPPGGSWASLDRFVEADPEIREEGSKADRACRPPAGSLNETAEEKDSQSKANKGEKQVEKKGGHSPAPSSSSMMALGSASFARYLNHLLLPAHQQARLVHSPSPPRFVQETETRSIKASGGNGQKPVAPQHCSVSAEKSVSPHSSPSVPSVAECEGSGEDTKAQAKNDDMVIMCKRSRRAAAAAVSVTCSMGEDGEQEKTKCPQGVALFDIGSDDDEDLDESSGKEKEARGKEGDQGGWGDDSIEEEDSIWYAQSPDEPSGDKRDTDPSSPSVHFSSADLDLLSGNLPSPSSTSAPISQTTSSSTQETARAPGAASPLAPFVDDFWALSAPPTNVPPPPPPPQPPSSSHLHKPPPP